MSIYHIPFTPADDDDDDDDGDDDNNVGSCGKVNFHQILDYNHQIILLNLCDFVWICQFYHWEIIYLQSIKDSSHV